MKKNKTPKKEKVEKKRAGIRWTLYAVLGAVCALVIGVYAWSASSGMMELECLTAKNTYYNLLVDGFRAGQLNLKTEVPPGLAQLPDPYDPVASDPFRWKIGHPLHDVSYYKGKLYLYFGITPALVLFWPYAVLTGHYLLHKEATVIFFSAGFLAGVGLLLAAWRRYFSEVSVWIIASCSIALGLANFTPVILERCDIYEVAISCGYAMTMLTLVGMWGALHDLRRQVLWLAGASLAYGLAIGARPSLLFGAVILLVPVFHAWREKRRVLPLLMAAVIPIVLIGLGLMVYNDFRFDNPLDFGQNYQLPRWPRPKGSHEFGLSYFWFNFRVAFLKPARWSSRFPYVNDIVMPSLPIGGGINEHPFGVLTNIPLVWLAMAMPLVWRSRPAEEGSSLRYFMGAVILLFGICALTICFHCAMCIRYEVEFADTLVLLAVIGYIGLERTLTGQLFWRRAVRCGWGLLLIISLVFNFFAMHTVAHMNLGRFFLEQGKVDEALVHYRKGVEFQPDDSGGHILLGEFLLLHNREDEGMMEFNKATELNPSDAGTHSRVGTILDKSKKYDEAISQFEQAMKLDPTNALHHKNIGLVFTRKNLPADALAQFREALKLNPKDADTHAELGNLLGKQGRVDEAEAEFKEALNLDPTIAGAQNGLGVVLDTKNHLDDAIKHFQEAVRLQPNLTRAHFNLASALLRKGHRTEAAAEFEEVVKQKPNYPQAAEQLRALREAH